MGHQGSGRRQRGRPLAIVPACVALTLLLAAPASAGSPFGGPNGKVDTDDDVRALVKAKKDKKIEDVLSGLSAAEQQTVIDRGLTPAGPLEAGMLDADGNEIATVTKRTARGVKVRARAALLRDSMVLYYCQQKSYVGLLLWRYNSRWTWTWGGVEVKAARHDEWGGQLAPGWNYGGSSYLWPSGGLYTSFIGRATRGHFYFRPAGWTITNEYPVHEVRVYGNGGHWHSCSW